MNKIRILGLALLAIGVVINFLPENDGVGFISGFLIGGGAVLLITGKIGRNKSK